MKITRYLSLDYNTITHEWSYSLIERNMGCADSFTRYKSDCNSNNYNTLEIDHIKSIKKELPKLHFILSKLHVKIKGNKVIGKKNRLVFCFRIIRIYFIKSNKPFIDILYDILKKSTVRIFNAIYLASYLYTIKTKKTIRRGFILNYINNIIKDNTLNYYINPSTNKLNSGSSRYINRVGGYNIFNNNIKIESHNKILKRYLSNYKYVISNNHNDRLYLLDSKIININSKNKCEFVNFLKNIKTKLELLSEEKDYRKALNMLKELQKETNSF